MKEKIITFSVIAFILLLVAFFAYFATSGKLSAVAQDNQIEINTKISCQQSSDCLKADKTLPENVYCKDTTCRFMDANSLVVLK